MRAAVGLGVGTTWAGDVLDQACFPEGWSWDWYRWLLSSMRHMADECSVDLVDVERALFVLDRKTVPVLERKYGRGKWLWSNYQPEAMNILRDLYPVAPDLV